MQAEGEQGQAGSGLANKQIARRLEISEKTVKAHLTSVYRQIGVATRTEAALWARDGWAGRSGSDPARSAAAASPRRPPA